MLAAVNPGSSSGQKGHSSPVFLAVFGVFFAAVGLLNALRPDLGFRMKRWQYKNKEAWEPSNAALVVARIGGCVAVVVGIVFVVVGLTR